MLRLQSTQPTSSTAAALLPSADPIPPMPKHSHDSKKHRSKVTHTYTVPACPLPHLIDDRSSIEVNPFAFFTSLLDNLDFYDWRTTAEHADNFSGTLLPVLEVISARKRY